MAPALQLARHCPKLANGALTKPQMRDQSTRLLTKVCSRPIHYTRNHVQPCGSQRNLLSTYALQGPPRSSLSDADGARLSQRLSNLQKSTSRLTSIPFRQLHQLRSVSTQPNTTDDVKSAPIVIPTNASPLIRLTPRPHENIYTIPNILTFSRLLAAPAVGYFVLTSQPLAALGLFIYAGATDALDGYLARRYNSQTVVGTVIDPMADKALMTIAVIALTVQAIFPVWLAVIILGRDIGLAISAIYFRWISLPPPKTMARFWDFSLPSAEVRPTEISKINTLLQLLLVGSAMVVPVLPVGVVQAWNLWGVLEGWEGLVAATTVWSGLSYVWNKDAVKILTREEIQKRMEGEDGDAQGGKGEKG